MSRFLVLLVSLSSALSQTLNFVAVGDYGGQPTAPYTTQPQLAVAKQLGIAAAAIGSNFTLGIGDNFYDSGVVTDHDARFKATWQDVYTADSLQSRWYIVGGNHDHNGNITAQVEHTHDDPRWYFPSLWYNQTFSIFNATIDFIFYDTVVFADYPDTQQAQDQLTWLEAQLAAAEADWLVVVGHYPVYSIAEHGPTPLIVSSLLPLMKKYDVDAYFCGHDHSLQHLNDGQIDFFLTGAGHLTDDSTAHKADVPAGYSKFFWAGSGAEAGGFITVEVAWDRMVVNYIDNTGAQIYQRIRPRF